jgi:hypothetical protein
VTQPHPSAPAGDSADAARFVTLSVPAPGTAAADVVLAHAGAPLHPDALVVAREPRGYAVRRVARVTADAVELLGDDGGPQRACADARDRVVGTVLLRWHVEDAA